MSGLVSVVLPVYKGKVTLASALESVLSQDIDAMEVIVIDDGSPDDSWMLVQEIKDDRIVLVRQSNRGLAATLNRGIELARGRYIARQDQDDLVLDERFRKQVAFLEEHPDVAIVGTWAQIYLGNIPTDRFHKHPAEHGTLRLELLFDNPFVHSSVMMRADLVRDIGGYCEDQARQPPEDFELWSRIARKHRVANLPKVLTIYREMPGSMSRTGDNPFLRNVIRIAAENIFEVLGNRYSYEQCYSLAELYHGCEPMNVKLGKANALKMLGEAAEAISGASTSWSQEFSASYSRMERHLASRYFRRRLPQPILTLARWVRNRLRKLMK